MWFYVFKCKKGVKNTLRRGRGIFAKTPIYVTVFSHFEVGNHSPCGNLLKLPAPVVLHPYSANQNSGFPATLKFQKSRLVSWWEKCDLDPIKSSHISRVTLWESTDSQLCDDINIIEAQNKKFCTICKRKQRKKIQFWGIFSGMKCTYLSK